MFRVIFWYQERPLSGSSPHAEHYQIWQKHYAYTIFLMIEYSLKYNDRVSFVKFVDTECFLHGFRQFILWYGINQRDLWLFRSTIARMREILMHCSCATCKKILFSFLLHCIYIHIYLYIFTRRSHSTQTNWEYYIPV